MSNYLALKYYHYTKVEDPVALQAQQHAYCEAHNLKGRIKIAAEGINGTLSGKMTDCQSYMEYLRKDPRFQEIDFNVTQVPEPIHEKLHIFHKKEIVNSGLPVEIVPSSNRSDRHYINGKTFQQMQGEEDVVIIDVRSKYEHKLGKFKNAITFDIQNFREFFPLASQYSFDKKKRYLLYCTRGIKCEKARDYLKKKCKVPHVYHLEGGILDYARDTTGAYFQGVCYIFDNRLTVNINEKNPTIISSCYLCQTPSYRMVNCANPTCNTHVPICQPCCQKNEGACSESCRVAPHKRPYNNTGYYIKSIPTPMPRSQNDTLSRKG